MKDRGASCWSQGGGSIFPSRLSPETFPVLGGEGGSSKLRTSQAWVRLNIRRTPGLVRFSASCLLSLLLLGRG